MTVPLTNTRETHAADRWLLHVERLREIQDFTPRTIPGVDEAIRWHLQQVAAVFGAAEAWMVDAQAVIDAARDHRCCRTEYCQPCAALAAFDAAHKEET